VTALARIGQNGAAADSGRASVRRLREEVARIRPPARRDGAEVQPPFEPSETWTPKQRAFQAALHELHPASALHLDHGDSWFGELAARSGIPTVVLGDDATVSRLVARAKADDLRLHPLVVDVRSPSPGYGIANRELPAATERLASELVIALDVVADLAAGDAIESPLDAAQIADSVAAFSTRRALVEVRLDGNGRRADHAAELRPALASRFRAVDVYAELGERALLVCEK
jgi:hypothetical protein